MENQGERGGGESEEAQLEIGLFTGDNVQKLQLILSHKRSLIVSFSRWTHLNTRGSLRDYGRIHKVPKKNKKK